MIASRARRVSGDGRVMRAKASRVQSGSAARAITCRPASIMPSKRQHRDEHRDDERQRLQPRIPGPHPQPEMQADHRVSPGDDQDQHLQVAVLGRPDEIDPQQISVVADIGVEKIVGDAGADDMAGEQDRDREAEDDLAQLGDAQPQAPPLPQRPQCQRVMDEKAAVEQRLRRPVRPDPEDVPQHILHRLERDQADRMVEQMHRHIGEHHQAAKEAAVAGSSKPDPSMRGANRLVIGRPASPIRRSRLCGCIAGRRRREKAQDGRHASEDARVCWRSDISSNISAR